MSVGEMALLTGQPRAATVYATEDSDLVQLSRAGFDRLTLQNFAAMARFASAIAPRLQRTQLAGILRAIFGNLSKPALHELQAELEWRHLANGHILFRQGDPSDALYIVVNGRLSIAVATPDGSRRIVDEVSRGEIVGELGVLAGEPRSATAIAIRDTDVVRLSNVSFDGLLKQYPEAMLRIARLAIKRLQPGAGTPARAGRNVATFAVIPASEDVPLDEFACRLVNALEAFGPTLHLDRQRLDRAVGKAGVAQTPITRRVLRSPAG